jgi:hypothetical protein
MDGGCVVKLNLPKQPETRRVQPMAYEWAKLPGVIVSMDFEDDGAVMVVTYRRRWWQFWRPLHSTARFTGERIA